MLPPDNHPLVADWNLTDKKLTVRFNSPYCMESATNLTIKIVCCASLKNSELSLITIFAHKEIVADSFSFFSACNSFYKDSENEVLLHCPFSERKLCSAFCSNYLVDFLHDAYLSKENRGSIINRRLKSDFYLFSSFALYFGQDLKNIEPDYEIREVSECIQMMTWFTDTLTPFRQAAHEFIATTFFKVCL